MVYAIMIIKESYHSGIDKIKDFRILGGTYSRICDVSDETDRMPDRMPDPFRIVLHYNLLESHTATLDILS